jgi:hypothetical protein
MEITRPGSHLDHLMRHTRWHHAYLSNMADTKANMMLTVGAVLITLSVGYLTQPLFHWAALTLIVACLLTIAMAAYAAMPKVHLAPKSAARERAAQPDFNLLFFGDFACLSYEDFAAAMETCMNDPSRTYEIQVRETYLLGVFLARKKYRFVRLAYLTFIFGLALSGLVLLATSLIMQANGLL